MEHYCYDKTIRNGLRLLIISVILSSCVNQITSEICMKGSELLRIDPERQLCCDEPFDRFDSDGFEQKCCTKTDNTTSGRTIRQIYVDKRQMCCDGELYDVNPHGHERPVCCGKDIIFDPIKSFCCNNKTYTPEHKHAATCLKSGGKEAYVRRGERACFLKTPNGTLVNVHQEQKGFDCCGLDFYRKSTHQCYSDMIWPITANVARCGEKVYDKNLNVCCESTDKGASELIQVSRSYETKVKYYKVQPEFECYENKIVDSDLETIIDGKVIPNHFVPCGDMYYDPKNQKRKAACCQGVVNYAPLWMNVGCCGKQFIDNDKATCCNDTEISTNQFCCGNKIYGRDSGLSCCGTQLIDNTQLCCHPQSSLYVPVKKKLGHNTCCGNQTFTYLKHGNVTCCGGKVVELAQSQECIGGQIITNEPVNPKELKDEVEALTNASGNQEKKERGNLNQIPCPSCKTYTEPLKSCTKKFQYTIYVRNITTRGKNTMVQILFLEPDILQKVKMVFRTEGHCRCYRKDELYLFQTNRNILARAKSGNMKMRFSKRDELHMIKGSFPKYRVDQKCKIDRYYKKPIVS